METKIVDRLCIALILLLCATLISMVTIYAEKQNNASQGRKMPTERKYETNKVL